LFAHPAVAAAACKIFEIISVKYLHRNYLLTCGGGGGGEAQKFLAALIETR